MSKDTTLVLRSGAAPTVLNPRPAREHRTLPWFKEPSTRKRGKKVRLVIVTLLLSLMALIVGNSFAGLQSGGNPANADGGVLAVSIPIPIPGPIGGVAKSVMDPCLWLGNVESRDKAPDWDTIGNVITTSEPSSRDAAEARGLVRPNGSTPPTYAASGVTPTVYEWFGAGSTEWKAYPIKDMGSDCGMPIVIQRIGVTSAGIIFNIAAGIAQIGFTIISWAISVDAFTPFAASVAEIVNDLKSQLFLEYLAPIVLLAAAWMAWNGLIKKRSRETIQGMVWTLAAGVASLIFLSNVSWITVGANNLVQGFTSGIIARVSNGPSEAEKNAAASEGVGASENVNGAGRKTSGPTQMCAASGPNAEQRAVTCSLWKVFVFTPWAAGQFGDMAGSNEQFSSTDLKDEYAVKIPGHGSSKDMILVYLDMASSNYDQRVSQPALDDNFKKRRDAQWTAIVNRICGQSDPNTPEGQRCSTIAKHKSAQISFTGIAWGGKVQTAFLTFIAIAVGMGPIMILAFTLVLMQITFVFLILLSPLFLLLGIHPGFGRKIALGWLEMVLSNGLKRIATAVLIGVLLLILESVISMQSISWIAQVFLIAAAGIAALLYRKKFLDLVGRLNLGGGGGQMGSEGQKAKAAGKKVAAKGAGAVGGAYGGREGGMRGILTGAVLGGVFARGGSPTTAARYGARRARGNVARKQAKHNREIELQQMQLQKLEDIKNAQRPEVQAQKMIAEMRRQQANVDSIAEIYNHDPKQAESMWREFLRENRDQGRAVAAAVGNHAAKMNKIAADMGVTMRNRVGKPQTSSPPPPDQQPTSPPPS